MWWPVAFVLCAAGLLPVQAAMNGAIARALGRPALAVAVSLTGSLIAIAVVGGLSGRLAGASWARASSVPWWAWPSGVCGAIFLLSQPVVLPRVGAATFTSLVVTGQVAMALLLDHAGALGLPQHAASPLRLAGAALIVAGITLVARG